MEQAPESAGKLPANGINTLPPTQETGWTPGPWEAHQGVLRDQPATWDVTSKHGWSGVCDATPEGWFVATVHEVDGAASAIANARLIAAAPELYEALAGLVGLANEGAMFSERIEAARAALSKANGHG